MCRFRPAARPRIILTSDRPMNIRIPEFCLVMLVGASGAGKTTFARRAFSASDVVGSQQSGRAEQGRVPAVLSQVIAERLSQRRFTVVDAPNLARAERAALMRLAKDHFAEAVAIVLDPDREDCHRNNNARQDAAVQPAVIDRQFEQLRRSVDGLAGEGFSDVYRLRARHQIDAAEVTFSPLDCDRRGQSGPFDIIGDVHGCRDELMALLERLGYKVALKGKGNRKTPRIETPAGRRAIFVGDLVDRGPASPDVLRIVMAMVEAGQAMCVLGNHDNKFMRWLQGRNVSLTHGLETTVAQFRHEPFELREPTRRFLESLPYQLWLDDGRLVVAHAGIRSDMVGRMGGAVREFCLFGDRSGEKDADGLPVRYHWALDYDGAATVVYGHTPVPEAAWVGNTLCVDTGCPFGGRLTALRWPEREIVSVPARSRYARRVRAFGHPPPRPARTGAGIEA